MLGFMILLCKGFMVVMLGVCMHLHSMLTAVPFTWKGGGKVTRQKDARVLHAKIAREKLQTVCHKLSEFVHSLTFDVFASSGNRNISSRGGGQRNVHASVLGDPQARPYHVQTQGGEAGA